LNATAGYDLHRIDGSSSYHGWNAGAVLSLPLYHGGSLRAAVSTAEAAVKKADAMLLSATENATQEVYQYYLEEVDARQRISATAVLIEQSTEGLMLSQERYKAGTASSIEITDAEITLANARISYIKAQFDYKIAHAKLLCATGQVYE